MTTRSYGNNGFSLIEGYIVGYIVGGFGLLSNLLLFLGWTANALLFTHIVIKYLFLFLIHSPLVNREPN
jgi:hypothetical protein